MKKTNTNLPNDLYSFIWHFLRPHKSFVLTFILFSMITGFWAPINSYLIKYIVDSLTTLQLNNAASLIFWPAVFFVINFEVHNFSWRGMQYLNYKFQPTIKNKIISETFEYIHKHSHRFFQDNLAGSISGQINILADNIERIVHDLSRHLVRCAVLLTVTFITMHYVHPKFFYVLLAWLIIFLSFGLRASSRIVGLSESYAASGSTVSGKLVDSITNNNNVRIFARNLYEVSYLKEPLLSTKKAFQTKEMFVIKLSYFEGISMSAMLGFMLYFLIQLRAMQKVSIGDFALILSLSIEIGYMTWWTMEQVDELNKAVGSCKQSLSKLLLPLEIQDQPNAPNLSVTCGQIVFSDVKFHYKGTEPLFQNKSVTIEAGQKVGLVGYSGGGKSTFVNLILRLYDVTDGRILIDNQDIREVTQDSLRSNIAMIPQDPSLFHRSVSENIRYGKIDAANEEVIEAAKRAHAHEFIGKLPQGYESLVGERGIKLSGGQRQRIAIARAILKNAPILILDEATSSLDSLTESYIQESLWELMQDKTTIVIAHRLSTLLHMDRILVFDQGEIIEDGSHHELLAHNGLYKNLWDAQVGEFLPDKED
jgi:ATP-binding cassette, subfamily B, bacterial